MCRQDLCKSFCKPFLSAAYVCLIFSPCARLNLMVFRFFHRPSHPVLGLKSDPNLLANSADFFISIGPVTICFWFRTALNHSKAASSTSPICQFSFVFSTKARLLLLFLVHFHCLSIVQVFSSLCLSHR